MFHRAVRRQLQLLLLCLVLLAAVATPARAHDSLAPPGTDSHRWLPHEMWVHDHWLPYDEARLREVLRVDDATVFRWLEDDHRTLAELARRRHVDPRTLVKRLLPGRRGQDARLRDRTRRMMTQGHLAQHVYFHVFHGPMLFTNFHRWFGVSAARYRHLRYARGLSPRAIAVRHGRDPAKLREHARARLRATAAEGVARGATSRLQADAMLARQERTLSCWVDRPAPKFDRTNPFGAPFGGHGRHRRGSHVGIRHPKPPRGCWRGLFR